MSTFDSVELTRSASATASRIALERAKNSITILFSKNYFRRRHLPATQLVSTLARVVPGRKTCEPFAQTHGPQSHRNRAESTLPSCNPQPELQVIHSF